MNAVALDIGILTHGYRKNVQRLVNSQPSLWLLPPSTGEVFSSFEHCFQRLQIFEVS